MSKIYPGDGTVIDSETGRVTNIAEEKKRKESYNKMTPRQKKLYDDFQNLKAKASWHKR